MGRARLLVRAARGVYLFAPAIPRHRGWLIEHIAQALRPGSFNKQRRFTMKYVATALTSRITPYVVDVCLLAPVVNAIDHRLCLWPALARRE